MRLSTRDGPEMTQTGHVTSDLPPLPAVTRSEVAAGAVGLRPTPAAFDAGNTLALANKESLIIGGPLVVERAKPGQIVPVDSEHSALAPCLPGGRRAEA